MGMGSGELQLIKELRTAGYIPDRGAIVEIGAQQLNHSFLARRGAIAEIGALFTAESSPPSFGRSANSTAENNLEGAPLAREFWRWLGFDYASIDIDGTPGSIPLDLNFDKVPDTAAGRFALVTNFGTTEHIANQLQAFKIIHDLAAVDGIMLHNVPMAGMLSHGFIAYNPRFFWSLARANGYRIVFMTLSRSEGAEPLPATISTEMAKHDPSLSLRFDDYRSTECSVLIALQKIFDAPFVPPLDVPEGAVTDHIALQSRYWSIFRPDPFAKRETDLLARKASIYDREQALAVAEEALAVRKQAAYQREQRLAAAEEALARRSPAWLLWVCRRWK